MTDALIGRPIFFAALLLAAGSVPAFASGCADEAAALARRLGIGSGAAVEAQAGVTPGSSGVELRPGTAASGTAGDRPRGDASAPGASASAAGASPSADRSTGSGAAPPRDTKAGGEDRPASTAAAQARSPTPPAAPALEPAERARVEALLVAARGAAAQGREDECREKLREAAREK